MTSEDTSVKLTISSSATDGVPYVKAFKASMPLIEFKRRIELVTGIYMHSMRLSLLNEGKFVAELTNEGATLEEYGVEDGYTIKGEDSSGKQPNFESGDVEHYTMDTESYKRRENTFRNFKKSYLRPDLTVGKQCVIESKSSERTGTIAFIGEVEFKAGTMIGVILDQPLGKHDGSVDGKRYFQCDAPYGVFVDPSIVKPIKAQPNGIRAAATRSE